MTESPTPEAPSPTPGTQGANRTTIIAIVVAVIAVMVALLAVVTRPSADTTAPAADATLTRPAEQSAPAEQQQVPEQLSPEQRDLIERRQAGDYTALGAVDAPVVMVEYSDYSCPYCGRFARDTKPELVRKYVETGVLRMEWRDYPVISENSALAAAAGRAAGLQGRFWEFNSAVYQLEPGTPLTVDRLRQIAGDLGLDGEKFAADLATDQVSQAIQADFESGRTLGVNSTPTFFVNGTLLQGALPLEQFEQVIEQHAAAAD